MPQRAGERSAVPADAFAVDVLPSLDRVVLTVRGDLDAATAPTMGALVSTLIDEGHRHVELDVTSVGFMDAAGLRVIVRAVDRLRLVGGDVSVVGASAAVTRLLDIADLTPLIAVDDSPSGGGAANPLRHIAALPADREVVQAALDLLIALAQQHVASDGVSVSLRRQGRLVTVAATDDRVLTLDRHQYDSSQGPCVDAAREGHPFSIEAVRDEQRWPAFTPWALRYGINSILSMPIAVDGASLGSLNLYGRLDDAFEARHELAATFAASASTIVALDGLTSSDEVAARRLQRSLRAREVIAQAQGVLIAARGMSPEQAHQHLRRRSRATSLPLVDCARHVVETGGRDSDDG